LLGRGFFSWPSVRYFNRQSFQPEGWTKWNRSKASPIL
jgi:hypothetical protein